MIAQAAARDVSGLRGLNAGCGPARLEDFIGLDRDPASAADVRHDLDDCPWPFEDSRFDRVLLSHVLEHLKDPDRAVREAHRVCRAGGQLRVVTPHYCSYESYGDITHRSHFGLVAFKPYYSGPRPLFRLVSRRLLFGSSPLSWPGWMLCAVSMELYEKYFAWIFPGRNMEFVFEALK